MSNPIRVLVGEHRLIRQFLDHLGYALQRLENGERPPRELFENAVLFARNFVDSYHHFKEEHQMFTLLAQKSGGELDGELEALRYQHERGRHQISQIVDALPGYTEGNEAKITQLLENVAAFRSMLRQHINREDHVFYPLVKQRLSPEELASLTEEFTKADAKAGDDIFDKSADQVDRMAGLARE